MRISANLGFLWTDRPLPQAIRDAAAAGFDAVECHWPYDQPVADIRAALRDTGLPMLGLNTRPGNLDRGEFGLAALPGRETEARAAIGEALDYAEAVDARAVHVMAGKVTGEAAFVAYLANLTYACRQAGQRTVLVEPLNRHDAPGYFLETTEQAATILDMVGAPNLMIMFDCYHVQRTEGDVITRLEALWPMIGHVQIAAVPDRGPPDHGELCYPAVFEALERLGPEMTVGAEYRPGGPTADSLGWLAELR